MQRNIIVIGASAGGVTALKRIVPELSPDLPAAIFIVLHTAPHGPRLMDRILTGAGDLPAAYAADGEPIRNGRIYLAPPDQHLLLRPDTVQVTRGPKENRHRPAIDPLFRSAAAHFGPRVIGVVLTGYLDDGTSGLLAVSQCGGVTVVQDPEEAEVPEMPASARRHVTVDHCVRLGALPALLTKLTGTPLGKDRPMTAPKEIEIEAEIPAFQHQDAAVVDTLGTRSTLTCPDCQGTLWEMKDAQLLRYRCHTGHAFTAESLSSAEDEAVEKALWIALKTLEERSSLAEKMAARAHEQNDPAAQKQFQERSGKATEQAEIIRKLLADA